MANRNTADGLTQCEGGCGTQLTGGRTICKPCYAAMQETWKTQDAAAPTDDDEPTDEPTDEPKTKAARTRGRAPQKPTEHDKPFQPVPWSYARTPRAIYRSNLSPMARLAYGALADVRQSETFKIGRRTLSEKMGVAEMTAWAALAELIAAGWIKRVVQRQGGHGPNVYRFTDTVYDL